MTQLPPSSDVPSTNNRVDVRPAENQFSPAPRRRSRGVALTAILVLVLAAAGVLTGYFVAKFANLSTQPATTPTETVVVKAPEKPKHTALLEELSRQISAGDIRSKGTAPMVQPDGYAYSVQPSESAPSLAVTRSSVDATVAIASITSFFKAKGYTEKIVSNTTTGNNGLTEYTTNEVKCQLDTTKQLVGDAKSAVDITVACLDLPGYAKLASTVKPLYEAEKTASTPTRSSSKSPLYIMHSDSIKSSRTTGFQLAKIETRIIGEPVGGYQGLYYQTPDSIWHFFKGVQSDVACSEFSSEPLKKAFLGEPCYDTTANKLSAVKL